MRTERKYVVLKKALQLGQRGVGGDDRVRICPGRTIELGHAGRKLVRLRASLPIR